MIKLRPILLGDWRRIKELQKSIKARTADELDMISFELTLVQEWDFVHAITGAPITPEDADALSVAQVRELDAAVGTALDGGSSVSKSRPQGANSVLVRGKNRQGRRRST